MFWLTVGRILWARRLIVAIVTLGALAGGGTVVVTADRQYDATARVILNIYKPDPITGFRLGRREIDPYLESQLNFIRDIQVVAPAVEAVGWLDDPDIQALYNSRPQGDQRPLLIWLAQSVAAALDTSLVEGSNIVEIRYRGSSPELAALVAGAVRDAYIAGSIDTRRRSAEADAASQAERAERLRLELVALQARKYAMEQQTGVLLNPRGADLDSERLLALAQPPPPGAFGSLVMAKPATLRGQLDQIDMELSQAGRTLGPSHPRLVEMRAMRSQLAVRVAAEEREAGGVGAVVTANERSKAVAFDSQRERVLSQRQDALRLRLVQDQINLKAKALEDSLERVANYRTLTTSTESGLTSIGDVKEIPGVAYPNVALVLGGTGGLGLIAGIMTALLVEMFNLRVRTLAGLRTAAPTPVLGVMPAIRDQPAKIRRRRPRRSDKLKPATA
jgi:succinoglycan biosynthesis transport protein ExoP